MHIPWWYAVVRDWRWRAWLETHQWPAVAVQYSRVEPATRAATEPVSYDID